MKAAHRHPSLRAAAASKPNESNFYQAVLLAITASFGRGSTPAQWDNGHGFHLPKNNGKLLCHGRRLFHCMSPISRAFRSMLVNGSTNIPLPLTFQCERFRHRCREETILSQNIIGHKVSQNHLLTALSCYDVTNDFPSLVWNAVTASLSAVQPFLNKKFLTQHVGNVKCVLDTPDGSLSLQPRAGVFLGSTISPSRKVCSHPVDRRLCQGGHQAHCRECGFRHRR